MLDRLTRNAPWLLSLAALAVLSAALYFEHALDYAPCKLCHWQRAPYYAALPVFLLPLLFGKTAVKPALLLFAALFAIDAGIAGFHVGVEQKWWQGPSTCTASGFLDDPMAALKQILEAPIVRCDEISWSFLDLSMAYWNMLIALALAALSLIALSRTGRRG